MKKLLLPLFLLLFNSLIYSQVNPTLAVGLEKLTMNKGTIDVEVLTEIIMSKQKELKQEALKRFMFKLFPEANFTTKYYVQNCLNVLLNEKNPQVIEKEILELTTNYALSLGVAYAIIKSNSKQLTIVDEKYNKYKFFSPYYQDVIIKQKENYFNNLTERTQLKTKIKTLEDSVAEQTKNLNEIDEKNDKKFQTLISKKNKLEKTRKELARLMLRENIIDDNSKNISDKVEESKVLISKISKYIVEEKILLQVENLNKIQVYLQDKNKSNKAISSLNNSLIDLDTLIVQFNTLSKKEDVLKANIQTLKKSNLHNIESEKISQKNKEGSNQYQDIKKINLENERKKINEKIENLKQHILEIPFGIILDVVSLSLSDIEELQKKGFFKNKIDYRTSEFYLNLDLNNESKEFKESLDNLKTQICKKITPYVQNYDVINEFLKKNKGRIVDDILEDLQKESLTIITPILNSPQWKEKYPSIQKSLNDIKNLDDFLTYINKQETTNQNQAILNTLICENNCNQDIISIYKEFFNLKNTFESLDDIIIDAEIREIINKIRNSIPEIKRSNSLIPNLSIINNPSDKTKININILIEKLNNEIAVLNDLKNRNKKDLVNTFLQDILILQDLINTSNESTTISQVINFETFKKENSFVVENEFKDKTENINRLINELAQEAKKKKLTGLLLEKRDDNYKSIAESNEFYNSYLMSILKEMEGEIPFKNDSLDVMTVTKASEILPQIYNKMKYLINNNDIHMSDIVYLEDFITDKMIELKIRDKNNDPFYNSIIAHTKIIIPLLKIKALQNIKGIGKYDEELMNLFEFISNLNNLDKAETYQSIVNMLRDGSKKVESNLPQGEFKDSYILFTNAMKKYTLINPAEEYVEIDVVSFLNELQQYYGRNNKAIFSLYLSLGLNQNFFFKDFKFSDQDKIKNISFASEKIGVKWRMNNFTRFEGYENVVKDDVYLNKKAPFINEWYLVVYGSGLLYSIANTTTNQNFDFPYIGFGPGMRFYNALDVNLTFGIPFVKDSNFGNNMFWGIALDIPLGEYLEKLGSKK